MAEINSNFKPPWWCRNPHLQTLWPYFFRTAPRPRYRRERLELDDGDFLDIDWFEPAPCTPIVVILHGLGGCSQSHYVRGLVIEAAVAGLRSAVLHHRGCSGEPNRLPRSYHGGDGGDLARVLSRLRSTEPHTPVFAVGYSLGGSMLLHCLAANRQSPLAACSISTPFELAKGADRMEYGLSRAYQTHLVGRMKYLVEQKAATVELPLAMSELKKVRTFREFDELVTAPLHGFESAEDYYYRCSCRRLLGNIRTPTLLIHAADDPLMSTDVIPKASELPDALSLELCSHGGHCGFVQGKWPHRPYYWAERRVVEYLLSFIK